MAPREVTQPIQILQIKKVWSLDGGLHPGRGRQKLLLLPTHNQAGPRAVAAAMASSEDPRDWGASPQIMGLEPDLDTSSGKRWQTTPQSRRKTCRVGWEVRAEDGYPPLEPPGFSSQGRTSLLFLVLTNLTECELPLEPVSGEEHVVKRMDVFMIRVTGKVAFSRAPALAQRDLLSHWLHW